MVAHERDSGSRSRLQCLSGYQRQTDQRYEADIGLYDYNARYYDPVLGRFIVSNARSLAWSIIKVSWWGRGPNACMELVGLIAVPSRCPNRLRYLIWHWGASAQLS